jgi:periplasmic divalent cation tolerance protein
MALPHRSRALAVDPCDVIVVLTTLPAGSDADAFARALVDERLAACVSVMAEMRSAYRWQGGVEQADERQAVIKTTRGRLARLEARLVELHPYELPELLVLAACGGSAAYLAWVRESTGT